MNPTSEDLPTRTADGPLRVVLVGAGKMARHHATAIAASRIPARLVAVADPSPEARAAVGQAAPGVEEHDSLEEALAAVEADVVHVCTPPSTHTELALQAIREGCAVYVEKPFAATESEARRILDAAAERDVAVCAGHQLLYERPARELRELLPALGDLQHVESYFAFRPVRGHGGQAPIRAEEQLLDILPHPVYTMLAAFESTGLDGRTEIASLEIGTGTIHAHLRRGPLTGSLVVTLTGRPVDSYLRVVGTNGSVHADFVRGIVLQQIGPGASGIEKLLAPYRMARQLAFGTTAAMARRIAGRKRSYPGLQEIFEAFYTHVRGEAEPPVSSASVLETVRVQERVASTLNAESVSDTAGESDGGATANGRMKDVVLVTGGTGFLGRAVVEELRTRDRPVRVLARRLPARWSRVPGVHYVTGDLADGFNASWLKGVSAVIHCAAATSGGWSEHQAASIDATDTLLDGLAAADCPRLVHVSSMAVIEDPDGVITESSPYLADPRGSGPYAWGKLESERRVRSRAEEIGLELTVVRPAAIVDYDDFEPPGRLGKRIGNLFVAVGSRAERLGVVGLDFCARAIAYLVEQEDAPPVVNLLDPELPSRRRLVERLRQRNPGLRVAWIPRWTIRPLGLLALGMQKLLRPGQTPIDVAAVFADRQYETSLAGRLEEASLEDRRIGPRASG